MKKILMIASEASHFKNFHIPYIDYLLKRKVEVYTASKGNFSFYGVTHFTIPYKKKLFSIGNIGVIFKLAKLIKSNNIDAVYTNSTLAGFTGRIAAALSGKKNRKIVHICHGYLFDNDQSLRSKVYLFFEKLVKNTTDILAVMNKDDYQIAKKYNLGKRIVYLNGMGLIPNNFPPVKAEEISKFKKSIGINNDEEYLFLCVGEFSERKHQQTIIEACEMLESNDYKVIFAGDGSLLESSQNYAEENNLQNKILFLGYCSQTNLLYRTCDCLISASRYEGMPFNVMESLYCGEKAIVTNVKGNKDLALEHGLQVYNFSDAETLALLMKDLVDEFIVKKERQEKTNLLNSKYIINSVLEENLTLLELLNTDCDSSK